MAVVAGEPAPVVEALREADVEVILGPGERHVEQPPLLVDAAGLAERHVGGDVAVGGVDDEHRAPLATLGRVDGGQDQVVVVEVRRAGQVAVDPEGRGSAR